MEKLTDDALLRQVDAFLKRTKLAPTRFGLEAMGDGALIKQLREGRSLTLKNANRVLDFMATYQPETRVAA